MHYVHCLCLRVRVWLQRFKYVNQYTMHAIHTHAQPFDISLSRLTLGSQGKALAQHIIQFNVNFSTIIYHLTIISMQHIHQPQRSSHFPPLTACSVVVDFVHCFGFYPRKGVQIKKNLSVSHTQTNTPIDHQHIFISFLLCQF